MASRLGRRGKIHSLHAAPKAYTMTTPRIEATEIVEPAKLFAPSMRALVFRGPDDIALEDRKIPEPGFGQAVMKVSVTTICGTDVHILKGEYPVKPGLTIGHEAVGTIHALGAGVTGYKLGDRVLVGAITPCGQCEYCLGGNLSQCGGTIGGWKFGNTIDGVQAEYVLIPNAQANMAIIPDELRDEEVILLADIASTGFSASETAPVMLGDVVAVFAAGPIGLCAILGASCTEPAASSPWMPIRTDCRRLCRWVLLTSSTSRNKILLLKSFVSPAVAEWMLPLRRWVCSRLSRTHCACSDQGARSRVSAFTQASWPSLRKPSLQGSAIIRSSQHCVRAARSACAGSWNW